MTTGKYQRFTREFKIEAVRLADSGDKPQAQLARELGIRVNQIHKWRKELEAKPGSAFPGSGRQAGPEGDVARLQREVERLKTENEILKKAAILFARESS